MEKQVNALRTGRVGVLGAFLVSGALMILRLWGPGLALLLVSLVTMVILRFQMATLRCVHCGEYLRLAGRGVPPVKFCMYCGGPLSLSVPDPPEDVPLDVYLQHGKQRQQEQVLAGAAALGGGVLLAASRKFQDAGMDQTAAIAFLGGGMLLFPGIWLLFHRSCPVCGKRLSTLIADTARFCYHCGAPLRPFLHSLQG